MAWNGEHLKKYYQWAPQINKELKRIQILQVMGAGGTTTKQIADNEP